MNCRHCHKPANFPFLDLGSAPLSNALLTKAQLVQPETTYPLRLVVCENCWLVQTEYAASREMVFHDDYVYFSSYSSSWVDHARRLVAEVTQRYKLDSNSCIVEIGANDGYLLQFVRNAGIPCYGIEPTAAAAASARSKGIEIIEDFFGFDLAQRLWDCGRSADLIIANNVLAHVPDLNNFVSAFARLLKPDGVATFEFPHLLTLTDQNQFDTVYHEHYSYFSLGTISRIFRSNGLDVFDVTELPSHGGSLRVSAHIMGCKTRDISPSVAAMLEKEKAAGMEELSYYSNFQQAAERVKNDFIEFLIKAKKNNHQVAAYGAAAKGNTLLNFAGVRPDLLSFVVDRNPYKQNKFLPGSRIPVVEETVLAEQKPDLIVLLPWNLRKEIMEQLAYAKEWGARFVTAVPEITVHS